MVKFKWTLKKIEIKENKLHITLLDLLSNKSKNASGAWINIWNYLTLFWKENLKNDLKDCLKGWNGEDSFSEKLKEYLKEKYINEPLQTEEIKVDITWDKEIARTNKEVFEIYKDDFLSYSDLHKKILKQWLIIYSELLKLEKYKELAKHIYFWWGTSLFFKYEKFYRFSKDLDFTIDLEFNTNYKSLVDDFIFDLSEWLYNYILKQDVKLELEGESDTRHLYFYDEFWHLRDVKLDTMGYPTYKEEFIEIDGNKIKISSPLDTICNKLLRLGKFDIPDIVYIIKKEKYSLELIKKCLRFKSKIMKGDENQYFRLIKLWGVWYEKLLPFLKEL